MDASVANRHSVRVEPSPPALSQRTCQPVAVGRTFRFDQTDAMKSAHKLADTFRIETLHPEGSVALRVRAFRQRLHHE